MGTFQRKLYTKKEKKLSGSFWEINILSEKLTTTTTTTDDGRRRRTNRHQKSSAAFRLAELKMRILGYSGGGGGGLGGP